MWGKTFFWFFTRVVCLSYNSLMENPIINPFIVRNKNPVTKTKIITGGAGGGPHPLIVQELCRRPTVQTMLSVQVSTLAPCLPKHFTTVDPVSRPFFCPTWFPTTTAHWYYQPVYPVSLSITHLCHIRAITTHSIHVWVMSFFRSINKIWRRQGHRDCYKILSFPSGPKLNSTVNA